MTGRRLWALALPVLWLAVLGSAAGVVYARYQARGPVRAPRKAQRRTRFARDGVGPAAARAERLVVARLRRAGGQRQAADDSAANPRRADRAPVKTRALDEDAPGEELPLALRAWCSALVVLRRRRRWWRGRSSCSWSITAFSPSRATSGPCAWSRSRRIAARSPTATASRWRSARRSTACGSIRRSSTTTSTSCRSSPRRSARTSSPWRGASPAIWTANSSTWRATCRRSRPRTSRRWAFPACICMREYRRYYPGGRGRGPRRRLHHRSTIRARRAWSSASTSC